MTIQDLIKLMQNRLTFLEQQRGGAVQRGDVALVQHIDADTMSTQATLDALVALAG